MLANRTCCFACFALVVFGLLLQLHSVAFWDVVLPCPQHMHQCLAARHCHPVGGSGDTEVLFGCSSAVTTHGCCVTPVPYDSSPMVYTMPLL